MYWYSHNYNLQIFHDLQNLLYIHRNVCETQYLKLENMLKLTPNSVSSKDILLVWWDLTGFYPSALICNVFY